MILLINLEKNILEMLKFLKKLYYFILTNKTIKIIDLNINIFN